MPNLSCPSPLLPEWQAPWAEERRALVGDSGFVGSTLRRQARFDLGFRSANVGELAGVDVDTLICAAAPAQKWLANREPERDLDNIDRLCAALATARCRQFILISTVDVFAHPVDVDEDTPVEEAGLHAYGLNRRRLERFVERTFAEHLIIRLPGLVGPGLRKNVIFDALNDNNVQAVDSRAVFQFYPMVNLWFDIQRARAAGLRLLHLTAAPVSVADVLGEGFGRAFDNPRPGTPAHYDLRSRHSAHWGLASPYQYSRSESLQAVRHYAQSEPRAQAAA